MINLSYSIGVPDKIRMIWADMEKIKAELDRFVKAKFTDNISVLVILGDYGTGKTHSLNYIRRISRNLKNIKLKIIVFEHPFENFIVFLDKIETFLPLEEIYTIVKRSIAKRKSQITKSLKKGYEEDILDSVMIFEKAHNLVLKTMYPRMHSDLRTILARILATESKEIFDLAKKWLRGVPLTPTQLRDLGVTGKISISNAPDISADYLRIFLSDGGYLLLLIDEFEDLGSIGDKRSLVSFRHFLDRNLPGLKMVVTMTDDAFEGLRTGKKVFIRKSYVPLWSRLDVSKKLRLSNLNQENSRLFLIDYLTSRDRSLKNKVKIDGNALQRIYKYTNGSPRKLTVIAQYFCSKSDFDGRLDNKTISAVEDDLELRMKKEIALEAKRTTPKI